MDSCWLIGVGNMFFFTYLFLMVLMVVFFVFLCSAFGKARKGNTRQLVGLGIFAQFIAIISIAELVLRTGDVLVFGSCPQHLPVALGVLTAIVVTVYASVIIVKNVKKAKEIAGKGIIITVVAGLLMSVFVNVSLYSFMYQNSQRDSDALPVLYRCIVDPIQTRIHENSRQNYAPITNQRNCVFPNSDY